MSATRDAHVQYLARTLIEAHRGVYGITGEQALIDFMLDAVDPDKCLPDDARLRRAVGLLRVHSEHLAREQRDSLAGRRAERPEADPNGRTAYRDPTGDRAVRNLMRGGR